MKTKFIFAFTSIALFLASLQIAQGEEGGAGQYLPGAFSSAVDLSPNLPGFAVATDFIFYGGDFSASRTLPVAGRLVAGLDAHVYLWDIAFAYTFKPEVLGAHYTIGISIPYVWMDARAQASIGNLSRQITDSTNGISDIVLVPMGLNWTFGGVQLNFQSIVYAPTGGYEVGRLANAGKNHWLFDQTLGASYTSQKTGTELSAFAGYAVSTENNATQYRNGDIFHLEGVIQQYLPLGSKTTLLGIGVNGFFYQQVTGDSGSGATLGAFKGRTAGVGPMLTFVKIMGKSALSVQVKWLPELDTERRLNGDWVWVSGGFKF
jgi:hypothetical protein